MKAIRTIYPLPLGEGAKREPARAKPQEMVRVSSLGETCTLTRRFAPPSPRGRGTNALLVLIFVSVTLLLPAAPAAPQRIVAIGDIHGDLDAFSGILQRAHLVDPTRRWSGGNTIFV